MHTADPAGGKDPDACRRGEHHGGGHRSASYRRLGDAEGDVAATYLQGRVTRLTKGLDFAFAQAQPDLSVDDGRGCRHGPSVRDRSPDRQRGLDVPRVRHAVRDDC